MGTVYDLRESDDPRDVVHRAVEALAGGDLVMLPTEAEYVLAASPSQPAAVERLLSLEEADDAPGLLFRSVELAGDWVPEISAVGQRLLDRCSPGPLVHSWEPARAERGAIASLTGMVREALLSQGRLRGWIPAHEFVQETLRLLPEPLVFCQLPENSPGLHERPDRVPSNGYTTIDDGPTRFPTPATRVVIDGESWHLEREGCVAVETLQRLASRVIVFVCTGNTCRSPMAAGLFRKLLADRLQCRPDELPVRGFIVESAGLAAGYGSPASPEAVSLLAERGVDLNDHASRPLNADTLNVADHIWTMTTGHLNSLRNAGGDVARRCELLAMSGRDVGDPFGGDRADYAACLTQIEELLQERLQTLPIPPT